MQHDGILLYTAGSLVQQNGGLDFSKPPFHKRVKMCLLYDGFFSFAVVRQIILYLIYQLSI